MWTDINVNECVCEWMWMVINEYMIVNGCEYEWIYIMNVYGNKCES